MKRDLEKTLAAIEGRVLAILHRMQDDDYGRLEAANEAAHNVECVMHAGTQVPDHHRLQLAIANCNVDAIYLARHRLLRRFQA